MQLDSNDGSQSFFTQTTKERACHDMKSERMATRVQFVCPLFAVIIRQ